MANTNLKIEAKVYGLTIAKLLLFIFAALGLSNEHVYRACLACLFMRTRCGNSASWHWLGRNND